MAVSVFDAFADEQRWVVWRNDEHGSFAYGVDAHLARHNAPETWLTKRAADHLAAALVNGTGGGVGIELGDIGSDLVLGAVELFDCLDPSRPQFIEPWAATILDALPTYAEASPATPGARKTAAQAFFCCAIDDGRPFLKAIGVPERFGDILGSPDDDITVKIFLSECYVPVSNQPIPRPRPYQIVTLDRPQLDRLAAIVLHYTQPRRTDEAGELGEWDFGAAAINPQAIPPRGWLLGTWMCRQFLSALFGDGAVGKTAVRVACALALATGRRDILNEHVFQRSRVLFLCFEDGEDELKRRICAAMLHHRIADADIAGYLFVRAISQSDLKLATDGEFGKLARGPLAAALGAAIRHRNIDAVFLDPLVKTHNLDENDNRAMDLVAEIIVDLAVTHNVAVDAAHHIAKGSGSPGNADAGRGASALKDGGRLIYTLNPMSPPEAELLGIAPPNRLEYIRIDQGKVNLTRRSDNPKWLRLVSVNLNNSSEIYPHGDSVQTVEPYQPKDFWSELNTTTLNSFLNLLEEEPTDD
jgi:hypothetical protein